MHWLAAHVYVSLLALAGLLLLAGAYIVRESGPSPTSDAAITWSGAGGSSYLGPNVSPETRPRISTEELLYGQNRVAEYSVLPVFSAVTGEDVGGGAAVNLDLEALLNQLAPPEGGTARMEGETGSDIYSFIPRGLISTTSTPVNRSDLQQSLFDYGNRAGAYIRAFDDAHTNMIQTLKNAYEDRSNPQKIAAAIKIGEDYQRLGENLEGMGDIPPSVASMHSAIANAYKDAGKKMILKLQTKTDNEFLAAMNTYNESVLEFTRRYIALVTYFSAAGVQFSTTDPGSVFMFTAVSF